MRSWVVIALFMFSSGGLKAQSKLRITQVAEGLYGYTTYGDYQGNPFPSNSMYAISSKGAVLIDTPWDTTQLLPLLDSIKAKHNLQVAFCVVTHFHEDRSACIGMLKNLGIETYTSQTTHRYLLKEGKPTGMKVMDTQPFESGDLRFESFYPGWGHTEDNIVVWFPAQKVLYGGCFIKSTESEGLGNIADANLPEWKNSLHKVKARYPVIKSVIPGHFGWEGDGLEHTLKLLEQN